jgi:hypothetical protein
MAGLAAYPGIRHWTATRTFVAVDMPVSLGPGHFRTGPFPINLSEKYTIWLTRDYKYPYNASCEEHVKLQTRWVLYRGGQVVAKSGEPFILGGYLDEFHAGRGIYDRMLKS